MATTMEQRAKFRELRLAGNSREDAMKQAYGEITQPTANPAVTPPTPTANPPQTMQGVNGETFQVAPTNPQTGLSQPAPTTPIATPTPAPAQAPIEAPAPTADRTAEIKAQNEAKMAENKQKSDLATAERKRQAEEARLASIPTDEKGVLNSLVSGVNVPKQSTKAYRSAEFKYNQYKKFATMTPTQLLDNMKMGEMGTEVSTLLAQNPNYIEAKLKYEEFQSTQATNNLYRSVYNGMRGIQNTEDAYQKASDSLTEKLGINETNADAYARIVSNDPEILSLSGSISSRSRQINELQARQNTIYEEIKKDYPDLSEGALARLMATHSGLKDITTRINALKDQNNLEQADFKMQFEMAKGEYEATKADISLQSDIAKEQRAMDNSLALSQMQFDQQIAQQAQTMNTPELAIPSVIDQYASLDIMAQKSAQQHIADAKAFIAKGGTLGQYITQMQKDFQAKPEYKAKFAKPVTQDWAKLDDTTLYNQKTGEMKKVSASEASSYGPSTADVTPDVIKGLSNRLSGDNVQCGMVSNDYMAVKFPGAKRMGDSYESKVASVESIGVSDVPQVGGVFAMNTYNSNGHTGIVQSVDLANGTFTATDANRAGSQNGGPVTTSTYKISDNFTFSKAPQGSSQGAGMTPEEIQELDALTNTSNLDKGYRARQVALQQKFNAVNDKAKKEIPAYNSLNRLLSNEGTQQGTSDNDVRYLREALSDYLKTGNEKVILDSIEARIINAKDKTPLKGIQDYAKLKLYADALNEYAKTGNPNALKAVQTSLASKFGLPTEQTEYKSFLENGNLNEVLRIAGTSFTDAFIERLNNIMITPKDTPEAVAQKLNGLLKKAELEVSPAKKLIGDDVLNKIYPGAFGSTPTFTGGNSSVPASTNYNFQSDWDNL